MTGDVKQYNAFVKYLVESRFGVTGGNLSDYTELVKLICNFLWEIDPHYYKSQKQGKSFPNKAVENFLGFNNPKSHGHKVGNMSMISVAFKIEGLKKFTDRSYMNIAHMQKLKGALQSVIEKWTAYMDILETQRVRSNENHNKSTESRIESNDTSLSDYVTTEIKMKIGISYSKYDSLKEELSNSDFYVPIMISEVKIGPHIVG